MEGFKMKKKGVCNLPSGLSIRTSFEVDENTNEKEDTFTHPFTGETCESVELEEDEK